MIVIKFLGLMDLLTGLFIILGNYHAVSARILLLFLIYLIIKGVLFRGDIASFIDLGIAVYMIILIFFPITIISFLAAIYLFQKGVFSLLG
jgi:hypothetical protein